MIPAYRIPPDPVKFLSLIAAFPGVSGAREFGQSHGLDRANMVSSLGVLEPTMRADE